MYAGGAPVAYYNADIVEAAGLSEAPSTWEDMVRLSERLQESSPGAITALVPSDHWFQADVILSLIGEQDPTFWDTLAYEGGAFDTDASRAGFAAYRELFETGALDPATLDVQNADAMALFGQGEAAMIFTGTWNAGLLLKSYREANGIQAAEVGVVPLPAQNADDRGIRSFIDVTLGIPTYSQNQEAAAKIIEFTTTGAGVDIWGQRLAGLPALEGWTMPEGVQTSDIAQQSYATLQELVANPHSDR